MHWQYVSAAHCVLAHTDVQSNRETSRWLATFADFLRNEGKLELRFTTFWSWEREIEYSGSFLEKLYRNNSFSLCSLLVLTRFLHWNEKFSKFGKITKNFWSIEICFFIWSDRIFGIGLVDNLKFFYKKIIEIWLNKDTFKKLKIFDFYLLFFFF